MKLLSMILKLCFFSWNFVGKTVRKQSSRGVFMKKETLAQVFSCGFCEISKSNFSYGTPGGCFWLFLWFWKIQKSVNVTLKNHATLKVVLQLYRNHTSTWVFSCKFAAYFQNNFFLTMKSFTNKVLNIVNWHEILHEIWHRIKTRFSGTQSIM